MEKEFVIQLKNGKVLTRDEAYQAKIQYEILCTQEYLEDNFSEIIPKDAMSIFATNVRCLMNGRGYTECEAIEELLKTSLPSLQKGGCL